MKKTFAIATTVALMICGIAYADVVVMNNGSKQVGSIQKLEKEIIITAANGNIIKVNKTDIKEQITEKELLKEFKAKLKKAGKDNAEEIENAAKWAFQQGLIQEGRDALELAIKANPNSEYSHKTLGHVKKGDAWVDPIAENDKDYLDKGYTLYKWKTWVLDANKKDKWKFTPEEIKEKSAPGKGWLVMTDHYLIWTSGTPDQAYGIARDMEEIYKVFYKVFQKEFDLHDIKERMLVNVYGTQNEYFDYVRRRFRVDPRGTTGFFFFQDRNLTTFVQPSLRDQISHEGFHQLLFHTMYVTNNSPNSTWVHEGIARYFQNSKWEGDKIVTTGGRNPGDIKIIKESVAAGKYPRLKEFVSKAFTYQKFNQYSAVCYSVASSYVEFLLNYENGKYKKGFFKHFIVVRNNYESVEQFQKDLGVDNIDDVQKEWETWIKKELGIGEEKKAEDKKN